MRARCFPDIILFTACLLLPGAAIAQVEQASNPAAEPSGQNNASWFSSTSAANFPAAETASPSDFDWRTGSNVSLAGKLFPHVHILSAVGTASRDPEDLRVGHHDPVRRDGWTLQDLEVGLSGRLDDHNEFFIVYGTSAGADDQLESEFEEAFWKLKNLPGGFELRGGIFFNRFGIQNTYHPHSYDWADQYLMSGRLLGDDPLRMMGGEVSWRAPVPWVSQFDLAWGEAPKHEDEEEPFGGQYNPEESHFANRFGTANWTNVYNLNDFHQFRAGVAGAWGTNHANYQTSIFGAHAEYQWRENGFDPGGRYFRVRSEAMFNRFKVEDELGIDPNPVTQQDAGFYLSALFGLPNNLEFGARTEFVAGNGETQRDARFRFSPGVTWYANATRTLLVRVQYNYDHSNVLGTDHSVWAQFGFNWGGREVR